MTDHATVVPILRNESKATDATVQLVDGLRRQILKELHERLDTMFDGADDLLFEFAERAANQEDRRLFFDTMRTVRLGRKGMTRRFSDEYSRGFSATRLPAVAPASNWPGDGELSLQNNETIELEIAMTNMASKAEGLYKALLWDVSGCVKALVEEQRAPLALDALAPMAICRAFRASAQTLNVGFDAELVVFKLFDRLVISQLGGLYTDALAYLKQHGVRSAHAGFSPEARAPGADGAATDSKGGAASRVAPMRKFSDSARSSERGEGNECRAPDGLAAAMMRTPMLDAQSLASLERFGSDLPSASATYSNASLAADLAAASRGEIVVGWSPRQSTAYVQRASLVGHMFNDILADPHLPGALRTQFDGLRLSAMKVALNDVAFINDPEHPVRSLINELATIASTARSGGSEQMDRIGDLVGQIQKQFDIAADTLRKPPPQIELIGAEQAERFIEQHLTQTSVRRQAIVKKVRRIIAEELQLRARGVMAVEEVRTLLNSLWAPMMALHLLRHGSDSVEWKRGLAAVDRLRAMLDPVAADQRSEAHVQSLRAELEADFKSVGLTETRIAAALDGLAAALARLDSGAARPAVTVDGGDAPDAAADADAAPAAEPVAELAQEPAAEVGNRPASLLELLVQPGTWFLVHDHDRSERRWMKAVAYYSGLDCAAFADFNGSNTLLLKSRMLLDDLMARNTVPVDLGPTARDALDRYLASAG